MEPVPETLSSLQTFIFKFIFPVFWISGFSVGTGMMWIPVLSGQRGDASPPELKFVFLAITIAGSAYIYWSCIRLKRVRMDGQFLYLSNYLREIQVPLAAVESVTEFRWENSHPVTIHFVRPTEFGSSVTFMPKMRPFGFFSSHPVVGRIRAAAKLQAPGL